MAENLRCGNLPGEPLLDELHPLVREAVMDAFKSAGSKDLYNGRVIEYLQVIKQALDSRQDEILLLKRKIGTAKRAFKGIYDK